MGMTLVYFMCSNFQKNIHILGSISFELDSVKVLSGTNGSKLLYYHHTSAETGIIITYEDKKNQFNLVSNESVSLPTYKEKLYNLWKWAC